MQLFEHEWIHILRIDQVERFVGDPMQAEISEYNACFHRYELVYFLSGQNTTLVDGVQMEDTAGSIRYMPKGQTRGRYRVERHTRSVCIDVFFDTDSPMPAHALGLRDCQAVQNLFLRLYHIWQAKQPGYYTKAMAMFYEIIHALQQQSRPYLPAGQKARMQQAYNYILQHYCDTVFDYAALCRMTGFQYAYFSELFRKAYRMPPSDVVLALRMEKAKELLVTGRHSVTEIAQKCGFSNVYYFSAVFKKQTGFAPTRYPFDAF